MKQMLFPFGAGALLLAVAGALLKLSCKDGELGEGVWCMLSLKLSVSSRHVPARISVGLLTVLTITTQSSGNLESTYDPPTHK